MTCYTALITPFDEEGCLDEEGLRKNLFRQQTVDGIAALGTTGEMPTLSLEEKKRFLSIARETDLALMVGCGANSTSQTIENLNLAADHGADSALVVTPYYNKPTQEGLFCHFETLARTSPLPIILYNIQGRTSVNLASETLKRLIAFPQIIGIKEASGSIEQITEAIALKKERPDFLVYAGDDLMTLPTMALGGDGVISVASNLVPMLMKELVDACQAGSYAHAQQVNALLLPLFKASNWETNPIPIKAAMEIAGFAAGSPRLPLTSLHKAYLAPLQKVVKDLI